MDNIVLEFGNIVKEYPGTLALNKVNFSLKAGEVHGLVGENGAGKSTLIKSCSGATIPNSGTITVNGSTFNHLTPILSRNNGIAVIYQEFDLIDELTVYENIYLGRAIRNGIFINKNAMIENSKKLFEQLEISIDPTALVKDLTVGYQQIVEIAKALSLETNILIMDEPSAALTNPEIQAMMNIISKLKKNGVSIIYISHHFDEIFNICDRVTVLRDGEHIKTADVKNITHDELIKYMVGRELNETFPKRDKLKNSDIVLEVKNLCGNGIENVSFKVQKGEILGLGGLIGAGRTELAEMLFGTVKPISGEILIEGKQVLLKNQMDAINMGIALVPEDRKRQGVLLHMSIKDNITIPILKRISKGFFINRKVEKEIINKYKDRLKIKTPNINQLVKNLSGGNQQKVVLAKWLAAEPDILIFDEPTRGIDIGAKREIYWIMDELTKQGKTLIMISSEMEELMGVSDKIIVLAEGKVTGELQKDEYDQEVILKFASTI